MPRLTLYHCTYYKGKSLSEERAKQDPALPLPFNAIYWQACPGGLNNSNCSSPNLGPRHIKLGPDFFCDWIDDGAEEEASKKSRKGKTPPKKSLYSLYQVKENEGFNKKHYFYKLILCKVGSSPHKQMVTLNQKFKSKKTKDISKELKDADVKVSCLFSDVAAEDCWEELRGVCEEKWDLDDRSYRSHVHVGIAGVSQEFYVGFQGLNECEEREEEWGIAPKEESKSKSYEKSWKSSTTKSKTDYKKKDGGKKSTTKSTKATKESAEWSEGEETEEG